MPLHANVTKWVNVLERQIFIKSGRVLKQCDLYNKMNADLYNKMDAELIYFSYIIVIYVVITVNYCRCMLLLYSPLNSYLYVHWILDFK